MTWRRSAVSRLALTLLVLAVAGLLLQAGSLQHTHGTASLGLYNQEHDLAFLAALATGGIVPDVPVALPFLVVLLLATAIAVAPLAWTRCLHADLRAPPGP
jgi:hypothetical protein